MEKGKKKREKEDDSYLDIKLTCIFLVYIGSYEFFNNESN
jgi:hypothetical protein